MNPHDKRSALFPIAAVALAMVALISMKSARDALFFTGTRIENLPLAYIGIAAASIPAAMLHVEAMRRWGTRATRVFLLIAVGVLFIVLSPFVSPENQAAVLILFVMVPVAFAAAFASVWLLAADLLENAATELKGRAYSWMGFAAMLGGMAGGLLAKVLSPSATPRFLILVGAVILIAVGLLVRQAHLKNPISPGEGGAAATRHAREAMSPKLFSRGMSLVKNRYVAGLIGLSTVIALCGLFIEFQFYAFAKISGRTNVDFFANFYTLLNLVGLVLQILAGSWIQQKFGTGMALMILPVSLMGGTVLVALNATLWTRSALRVLEAGLKASTHRFAWEQTYLPVKAGHRDMTKALVDGLFAKLAEGLGAGVLFLWLSTRSASLDESSLWWMTGAITAFLILWILLILYLLGRGCGESRTFDEMLRFPDCCQTAASLGIGLPK